MQNYGIHRTTFFPLTLAVAPQLDSVSNSALSSLGTWLKWWFDMQCLLLCSHSSVVDDTIEEHKLLSQRPEKARLKELAGDELEEDEGGGATEGADEAAIRLRETIKIERDQKVCHFSLHVN